MKYLLFLLNIQCIFAASITDTPHYTTACLQAAKDAFAFMNFKQNPNYQFALEHVTYEQGLGYLRILELEYPEVIACVEKCKENDLWGNPKTYAYGIYGSLSPTTLRYMKVAGDLTNLFGDLKEKKIIEIGGGYGGQCKILHEVSGFKDYVIIDLPEVSLLQEKYLSLMNINNVLYLNNKSFCSKNLSCDLVVSNYAFTEISKDEQLIYIEKIINNSKSGYITCNFISAGQGIKSLTLDEIINLIEMPNRKIQLFQKDPALTQRM